MLHLHYYPSTASMVPHIVLEELGVPYQRVLVDRAVDAHKAPEYLKLNPNGLIPVLTQDDAPGGRRWCCTRRRPSCCTCATRIPRPGWRRRCR